MSLPLHDWQFWVTTVAAIIALYFVARTVLPRKKTMKRTNLTIGGKRIK